MTVIEREIKVLILDNGKCPFREWRNKIKDKTLGAAIDSRLSRIRTGNMGDRKHIGESIYELRIPKGPGLRIYYACEGQNVVILLGGGDKNHQSNDISKARKLWRLYQNEN